jgi:hypothetical protein
MRPKKLTPTEAKAYREARKKARIEFEAKMAIAVEKTKAKYFQL